MLAAGIVDRDIRAVRVLSGGTDERVDGRGTEGDGDALRGVPHLRRGAPGEDAVGAHAAHADRGAELAWLHGLGVRGRGGRGLDVRCADRPGGGDLARGEVGRQDQVGVDGVAVGVHGDRVAEPDVVDAVGHGDDEPSAFAGDDLPLGDIAAGSRDDGRGARQEDESLGHVGGNPSKLRQRCGTS